jgi:NAD(P)H dehydrogenase (quinone)
MPFNADTDFDAEGRLRPDAPSHWPFIRHPD